MKIINNKILLEKFLEVCEDKQIKAHNMGTNQLSALFEPLNKKIQWQENCSFKINKIYVNGKERFTLKILKNNQEINVLNDPLAKSTINQKIQMLEGIGMIEQDSKIIKFWNFEEVIAKVSWKYISNLKNMWELNNGLIMLINYIINSSNLQNKKKENNSLATSYLLNYFYDTIKEDTIIKLPLDSVILEKAKLLGKNKERFSKEKYIFDFVTDKKNNFSNQWDLIKEHLTSDEINHLVQKSIISLSNTKIEFEDKTDDEILEKDFNTIKELINDKELNNNEFNIISNEINKNNWRSRQTRWRNELIRIRELQGREKDDIDKYKLKNLAVEACHIVPVQYYKNKIKIAMEQNKKELVVKLWLEMFNTQNGMMLPSDYHKNYDGKKAEINTQKNTIKLITENKEKGIFIPYNSFLREKIAILQEEDFKVK